MITLTHPTSGAKMQIEEGFSWTVFFFGFIALFLRRQIGLGLAHLFLMLAIGATVYGLICIPIIWIWFGYTANSANLNRLKEIGWAEKDNNANLSSADAKSTPNSE